MWTISSLVCLFYYGERHKRSINIPKSYAALDAVNNDGNTALHLAVTTQSPELVTLLLKNGANFSIRNNEQMMPLHLAAELSNVYVMKVSHDVYAIILKP